MIDIWVLVQFIVVFVTPLLLASGIFYFIPTDKIDATLDGTIKGVTIKASGAAAFYLIMCLVAAYVYEMLADTGKQFVPGEFAINVTGTTDKAIEDFFRENGTRIRVDFKIGTEVVAKSAGFNEDDSTRQLVSQNFQFEKRLLGQKVNVEIHPHPANWHLTEEDTGIVITEKGFSMNLAVQDKNSGDWTSPVEVAQVNYLNGGRETVATQLIIFDNNSTSDLSLIEFTTIEASDITLASIDVRALSEADRTSLVGKLERPALGIGVTDSDNAGAKMPADIDTQFNAFDALSVELGHYALDANALGPMAAAKPELHKDAVFMRGITPRIELSKPRKPGQSIAVRIVIHRKSAEPLVELAGDPDIVGRRVRYLTEHLIYLFQSSDGSLTLANKDRELEYADRRGSISPFGDARRIKAQDRSYQLVDLLNVEAGSIIRIPLFWTAAPK